MNDRNNSIAVNWMRRRSPPPTAPVVSSPPERPMGRRHSVITTRLPNWYTYKNWVDNTRESWQGKK